MRIVVDELLHNPAVIVGGLRSDPGDPDGSALNVFTCPLEPIYDSEELNDFMQEMVTPKPSYIDYFSDSFETVDKLLMLGRLGFNESVVDLSSAHLFLRQHFHHGTEIEDIKCSM